MEGAKLNPESIARRQSRGRDTRADIIAIAKRLFSEHGYHSTGLSDIQDATGLSKGAFYHHFRSKEELALAVLEDARCEYADRLIGPAMTPPTPAERIIALLHGVLERNADPQWRNCQMMATLCAELTGQNGRIRDAVQAMQLAMNACWRDLLLAAQEAGQIDPQLDATLWAQWISHTFIGLLLARKLGTLEAPPEQVVEQIKAILFNTRTAMPRSAGVRQTGRRKEERKPKS